LVATGTVNWADEVDELNLTRESCLPPLGVRCSFSILLSFYCAGLPTYGAGGDRDRDGPRRGSDWLSSQPDRADRMMDSARDGGFERGPPRQELPLPSAPPYTAFVGNLSFDVTEPEVEDFFAPSKVSGGKGEKTQT
jgi:hypothetical protein